MKKTNNLPSLLIPLFSIIILNNSLCWAEKVKVKKVKGNQAVIETLTPLEEGQSYELALEPVSQDVNYKQSLNKTRDNSLTFGTSYEYIKSDLLQRSQFNLQARYGWNFSSVEFGVLIDLTSLDQGSGATNQYSAGGYFDYNLVANREPNQLIYGPFALAAAGSTQYPTSQTGGSSSTIRTNAGGFLTYFLSGSTTALRGEGFYNYQQINTTAQQNSVAGFGLRGLLMFYF